MSSFPSLLLYLITLCNSNLEKMSRDDTTLIIAVRIYGRRAYIILQVQAAENFEKFEWLRYYLWSFVKLPIKFTRDLETARKLAQKIDKSAWRGGTEYGVRELWEHKSTVLELDSQRMPTEAPDPWAHLYSKK